jgi:LPXTG-motif cell wall-anchored protein
VSGYTAAYFDSTGGQLEAVTETSDDKVQTGYKIGEFTGYNAAVGGTVTIRNLPAYTLPATGGPGALPFVAAGCTLVALAALLALFARRRYLQQ